eukprot:3794149-Rhodomonas_salina.1
MQGSARTSFRTHLVCFAGHNPVGHVSVLPSDSVTLHVGGFGTDCRVCTMSSVLWPCCPCVRPLPLLLHIPLILCEFFGVSFIAVAHPASLLPLSSCMQPQPVVCSEVPSERPDDVHSDLGSAAAIDTATNASTGSPKENLDPVVKESFTKDNCTGEVVNKVFSAILEASISDGKPILVVPVVQSSGWGKSHMLLMSEDKQAWKLGEAAWLAPSSRFLSQNGSFAVERYPPAHRLTRHSQPFSPLVGCIATVSEECRAIQFPCFRHWRGNPRGRKGGCAKA